MELSDGSDNSCQHSCTHLSTDTEEQETTSAVTASQEERRHSRRRGKEAALSDSRHYCDTEQAGTVRHNPLAHISALKKVLSSL